MTQIVLPTHTNRFGTVFGGQIASWIDICAAVAAMRHSGTLAVTASMDSLHFLHGARQGDVVTLRSQVNLVGRTSMEVGVRVESEDPVTGARHHTASAYLTFVAVDAQGCPQPVPPLRLETDEDRRRHEKAQRRRAARLRERELLRQRERGGSVP
ncbi:MAG: acyl-CoA thioesterase [Deltaproteobacteria bacterium]|nr:MAG: acyl-CoA thioesterase [Deltaproteobacteria bacterium]